MGIVRNVVIEVMPLPLPTLNIEQGNPTPAYPAQAGADVPPLPLPALNFGQDKKAKPADAQGGAEVEPLPLPTMEGNR